MGILKCPGQDRRFWKPEDIFEVECPSCGSKIEFWKDDVRQKCNGCGSELLNPRLDLACAQWCQYAEKCLAGLTLEERIIAEVFSIFREAPARMEHTFSVLKFARQILAAEGGDAQVVTAAALLHDIGIKRAEEKCGGSEACYQEKEGPPIAREILTRLGVEDKVTDEACEIIAHHHTRPEMTSPNARIIWDANLLANINEKPVKPERDDAISLFLTETGKRLLETLIEKPNSKRRC